MSLRLGIHTFTSGSLEKAALKAAELGANAFQIFSASPRMWRARLPDSVQVKLLKAARGRFGLHPLAIHVNYLINLASLDPVIRPKSIEAFRGELDRAAAIGAEYLVLHPGNYKGRSVEEGIAAFVLGLKEAAEGFHAHGLTVLLENTAGSGASLGSRLEELRSIRELAGELTELPIGYCLDTCHLLAAGFNVATAAGLGATIGRIEKTIGLANVHLRVPAWTVTLTLAPASSVWRVSGAFCGIPSCGRNRSSSKLRWISRATTSGISIR